MLRSVPLGLFQPGIRSHNGNVGIAARYRKATRASADGPGTPLEARPRRLGG